jgi:hypothetical protein
MSTPSGLVVEITPARVEHVAAEGLLLPVDGDVCRLGGAAASAMRQALPAEERAEELQYVEDELARLRPLAHPQARAIDGVARWRTIVVSAAYRMSVEQAIRAFADGLLREAKQPIRFCWSLPELAQCEQAAAVCQRRGLVVFREAI